MIPAATVDKSVDTQLDSSKSEPASTPTLADDEKSSPDNENQEKEKEQPPEKDDKTMTSKVTDEFEDDPDALEALVTADADS